ncbi:MAG: DUF4386 domain-containing protein [Acidimicrobiia bacterium]
MFSFKTIARIVGVLFIIASVTAIAGGSLLLPLSEPDYLAATAVAESQIVSGVLLELVLVMSVIAIAAMFYPVLKRQNDGLALGYVGARTIEGILLLAAAVSGLLVLSVGSDHGAATAGVQPVGDTLLATREWTYLIGSLVMLGVSALILNSLLYRSRLVPAWLSIWGLFAGVLIALRGLGEMYGIDFSGVIQGVLAAPIAVQEMVLALWLIIKGFDTGHLPGRTRETDAPNLAIPEMESV